jgi:hypothetical protein
MNEVVFDTVRKEPRDRLTMNQVATQFAQIRASIRPGILGLRIANRGESPLSLIFRDIWHQIRPVFVYLRSMAVRRDHFLYPIASVFTEGNGLPLAVGFFNISTYPAFALLFYSSYNTR